MHCVCLPKLHVYYILLNTSTPSLYIYMYIHVIGTCVAGKNIAEVKVHLLQVPNNTASTLVHAFAADLLQSYNYKESITNIVAFLSTA